MRSRGMTLMELLVVIGILGALALVALPSLESVTGVRAREEAGRLSAAIRYLYGISALHGQVCRLAFDLDENSYKAECTQDRFTVAQERSLGGERIADKNESDEELRDTDPLGDEAVRARVEKRASFSAADEDEIPLRKLPSGTNLSVWTSHQTEKYVKGMAYLYFFPQGHTEKARIWVSNNYGDTYTLSVSPLNGRVLVSAEELEVPRG